MTEPLVVVLLAGVAFVAGFVDSIAGGGGLVSVPALLTFTPDPRIALGTNKGQSVFGAVAALVSYGRAGRIDRGRAIASFTAAFVGALLGAAAMLRVNTSTLRPVSAALLFVVALSFAFGRSKKAGHEARPAEARPVEPVAARPGAAAPVRKPAGLAWVIGFSLGFYDGFFGPGTGTLLIAAFAFLYGDDLVRASANAKVPNFASNLASVITFALAGAIDWRLALPMACTQIAGSMLGARSALKVGERLVRGLVVAVALVVAGRLVWHELAPHLGFAA